jgi:hypothetical protein
LNVTDPQIITGKAKIRVTVEGALPGHAAWEINRGDQNTVKAFSREREP